MIAQELGYEYTEYLNTDIISFMHGGNNYSEAWKRDFGWMGQLSDFAKYHKLHPKLGIYTW